MGLFESWYELELKEGLTQAEILVQLNSACGTHYKSNWVSQGLGRKQGLERTPTAVRRYMVHKVLADRLRKLGVTDEQVIQSLLDDLL